MLAQFFLRHGVVNNNNNNTLIYIAPACRMTSEVDQLQPLPGWTKETW